jgi:hypothetical protein
MAEGVLYVKAKVSTSAILGELRANVAKVTEGLIFDGLGQILRGSSLFDV